MLGALAKTAVIARDSGDEAQETGPKGQSQTAGPNTSQALGSGPLEAENTATPLSASLPIPLLPSEFRFSQPPAPVLRVLKLLHRGEMPPVTMGAGVGA